MSLMRKKSVIAVIATMSLMLMALTATSFYIKRQFEPAQQQWAASNHGHFRVISYSAGLFNSSSQACWQWDGVPMPELCLDYQIQHGPLLWQSGLSLGLASVHLTPVLDFHNQVLLKPFLGERALADIYLQLGYSGDLIFNGQTASLTGSDVNGQINMSPLSINGHYAHEQLVMHAKWSSLETAGIPSLEVANVQLNGYFHKTPGGIWLGNADFGVAKIEAKAGNKTLFSLNQLSLKSDSRIVDSDSTVNNHFDFDLGNLELPDHAAVRAGISLRIYGIAVTAMEQFSQETEQWSNKSVSTDPVELMNKMRDSYGRLLAMGAHVDMPRFQVFLGGEPVNGRLSLTVKPEQTSDTTDSFVKKDLAERLQGNMAFRLPRLGLQSWSSLESIQSWLQSGLAVDEQGMLVFDAEIHDAQLRLGNQQIPLHAVPPSQMVVTEPEAIAPPLTSVTSGKSYSQKKNPVAVRKRSER